MAETQTSFTGSVSFPQIEDARQFRTLLNAFLLRVRIRVEEGALAELGPGGRNGVGG